MTTHEYDDINEHDKKITKHSNIPNNNSQNEYRIHFHRNTL